MNKSVKIVLIVLLVLAAVGAAGSYIYWQRVKQRPEYSLALLVKAAQDKDAATINELVDTNAIVDGFVPQVFYKATELYGRGIPPAAVERLSFIATPLLPQVKERVRTELPETLHRHTENLAEVPFLVLVIAADQYVKVTQERDSATIEIPAYREGFEIRMRRNDQIWHVVGIKDDEMAAAVAHSIGQQLIGAAASSDLNKAGEKIGIKELESLIKQATGILEQK